MTEDTTDDNAPLTDDDLAEIDEWLDELEPGCDGWYIEVRLVRALRDEVNRLRTALVDLASEGDFDAASDETRIRVRDLLRMTS